jgi:DNA-binding XRE family transcriptional regulator
VQTLRRLADRLRVARRRRRWTQQKMATLMGVGLNTYRRMEQGSPEVAMGTWLRVFEVLGMLHEFDGILLYDHDQIGAAMQRHYRDEKRDRRLGKLSIEEVAERI